MPGLTEQKPVAYFTGRKKGLILSPTNQRTLKALFGDDVSGCKDKLVMLEAVPMRFAGRDTLPIRIGPAQQPNGQAKEAQVTTLHKQYLQAIPNLPKIGLNRPRANDILRCAQYNKIMTVLDKGLLRVVES